jgi:uncharacterized protein (TIGR03492 family)
MKRVLFVTNGHGEVAIASKIAEELVTLVPIGCDHLALVGDFEHPSVMRDAGPRRRMPSGGLLAMGNLRNIARDVRAGLIAHTIAQLRFLRGARGTYAMAIAVGDVFALLMAMRAGTRTAFVGTAKSIYVAPYGPLEERVIRSAQLVYVRDEATAQHLRGHEIAANAGNVIVDLYGEGEPAEIECSPRLALFPGSREEAYGDAAFLCAVTCELARKHERLCAFLSIAPGLDAARFRAKLEESGWRLENAPDELRPFVAYAGDRALVHAWRGPIGAMLRGADAVLGQAGTANEAAAAAGIPVVAFARSDRAKNSWYRRRQAGLLGEALSIVRGDARESASQVDALLADANRRERMAAIGRQRMGAPGAAKRIARDLAGLLT